MIFLKPVSKEEARRELVLIILQQIRKDRMLRESQKLLKRTLWFIKINQSSLSKLIIKINPRSHNILFDMLTINSIGIRAGTLTYLGEFQGIYSGLMHNTLGEGAMFVICWLPCVCH